MVEGGIKSAARGTAARAESESIEAPSRYLYLFGGLSARSPFGYRLKSKIESGVDLRNLLKTYKLYGYFFNKIFIGRKPVDGV